MPDETSDRLFRIIVEGKEAQAALEGLQQSFKRMEEAVVSMGEKFDAAISRMIEPINALTTSVDTLNASIGGMQRNLGDVSGLQAQSQAAQQATVDLGHLRRTIEQYRAPAFGREAYQVPGGVPGGGRIASRQQMIERYMAGQFGPTPTPAAPTMGPTMMAAQFRNLQEASARLGPTVTKQLQEAAASQKEYIESVGELLGLSDKEVARLKEVAGAQEQVAESTRRTTGETRRASSMFRYFGRYLLRYLLLWQSIQAVRGIARAWFAAHVEMADAVADFGWRVNATADDLERYRAKLRDVSTLVGMPVAEIASPLAGRATEADLLRAAEASKVFGGSVEDWLRTLERSDATLDAYAHGLRISTLATEDYAKLVDNASGIAKEFNMTEEETIGLLSALPSVLQADAEGAAELTEALAGLYEQNQLLMTLGVAPAVTVGPGGAPQRRPLQEVMEGIGRLPIERQRQLAVAIGLTSREQQQFFLDAVAGWAEVERGIRGTVDATDDFGDAIAGAEQKLSAHTDSMKAAWSSLLERIGDTQFTKDAVDVLTMAFKGWGMMIDEVGKGLETLEEKASWLKAFMPAWMQIPGTLHAMAELYRGTETATREAITRTGEAGRGFAGITPGTEVGGTQYLTELRTMRLQEGMTMGQLAAEMERVIAEEFTQPFQTETGEWIQITKEQIDTQRELILVLDETGEALGYLNAYAPALSAATENLKTEMARFNLERLKDIEPEQFDIAMRTILPMWEARLGAIPGFEEERELHTFFVGEQDILRQQLATQTGMAYTLQDILDTEKDQLEGMWNIPSGVTMRVPLTSLDLMRWMRGAGGGVATDMMLGPGTPGGALEAAATAQDTASTAMQMSAGAQTAAAASMSQLSLSLGQKLTGAEVEAGVAREALAAEGIEPMPFTPGAGGHGRRGRPAGRPFREIPTVPTAIPAGGGPLAANFVISLMSTLLLDGKVVAEVVQTELARQLVNTTRATSGRGASLRP